MKKTINLGLLFFLFIGNIQAQTTEIIRPWNIKLGYTSTPQYYSDIFNANNLIIETNYRLFKPLDIGIYAGLGQNKIDLYNYHQYNFGTNFNLQLLPLITQDANLRLNMYLSAKIGFVYNSFSDNREFGNMMQLTYGLYFGMEYFITKNIGIFVESGYAKINDNRFNLRVGVSCKF